MLYTNLSGAFSAAPDISFGPNISLQPSTASSLARHKAIIGPLQTRWQKTIINKKKFTDKRQFLSMFLVSILNNYDHVQNSKFKKNGKSCLLQKKKNLVFIFNNLTGLTFLQTDT